MTEQVKQLPEWVNKKFLEDILKKKRVTSEDVKVSEFHTVVTGDENETFVSEFSRFVVETNVGRFNLILKRRLECEDRYAMTKQYQLFGVECRIYSDYLPEFYEILKKVNEYELLAPEAFNLDDVNESIILKDLSVEGFKTCDMKTRIPLDAAHTLLRKLAKFHAASMVCNWKRGGELEQHKYYHFSCDGPFRDIFVSHVMGFIEEIRTWGPKYEHLFPKLDYISANYAKLADKVSQSEKGLNSLIHADLWFNNVLICMDPETGTCKDVAMIDFQTTLWASLALDLIHFFMTSLSEEYYQDKFEELIAIYHAHLHKVLTKCNYHKVPTFEDVWREVKEKLFHGFFSAGFAKVTINALDSADSNVLDGQLNGGAEGAIKRKFQSPRLKEELKYIVNFMDKFGAFDYNLDN